MSMISNYRVSNIPSVFIIYSNSDIIELHITIASHNQISIIISLQPNIYIYLSILYTLNARLRSW